MNQIAVAEKIDAEQVNDTVLSWREDLSGVVSTDVDIDKFIAAVTTALAMNPDIVEKCTRDSIKHACIKAAYDGLRPDGKEGALVPYYDDKAKEMRAQWLPMVYGIRKKAKEHDGILIDAHVVYKADKFLHVEGDDERIEHEPAALDIDPGEIIGAYAIFRRGSEILHREVLRKSHIDRVRAISKAPGSPAYKVWPDEMAKKAAVKRGAKTVPMSDRVAVVMRRDEDFQYRLDDDVAAAAGVSLADRYRPREISAPGFSAGPIIDPLQDKTPSEAHRAAPGKTTARATKGDEPATSTMPSSRDDGGAGDSSPKDSRPQNSSSAKDGGDKGGGGTATDRLSADEFREYHGGLARMATKESLEKAHNAFFAKDRFASKEDLELITQISDAHVQRVTGKIDASYVGQNVDKWIEERMAQ